MDDWITVEEAARILAVSSRQAYRYAKGDPPKVRSMEAGRRVLFNRLDVQSLADELNSEYRPRPAKDSVDAGELLQLVRSLQTDIATAYRRIGELEGQLSQRLFPDDERSLRDAVVTMRVQLEERDRQIQELKRQLPWYRRFFAK